MTRPSHVLSAVAIAALATLPSTSATAEPGLSEALGRWFSTDPSIACVDQAGRDRRCSVSQAEHVGIHRGPDNTVALVFVTYLPDSTATGNAVQVAAATFRRDRAGWRFARNIPARGGEPIGEVTFAGGRVSYAVAAPLPGDPRCCPSGRRMASLDLR